MMPVYIINSGNGFRVTDGYRYYSYHPLTFEQAKKQAIAINISISKNKK
jgi:hypothetical protein